MPNVYFTKVTADYWTAKNKLQQEVKEFARACERMILKPDAVKDWMAYLKSGVSKLNQQHKRCKPLRVETDKDRQTGDIKVFIYGVSHLSVYAGKEVYHGK